MNTMRLAGKSLTSWRLRDPKLSRVNHPMTPIVRIPGSASQSFPHAIDLARMALSFTIEKPRDDCNYVAIFTWLRRSLDLAVG